jgi:prepilin-type processing-associated H-X9-DG protein
MYNGENKGLFPPAQQYIISANAGLASGGFAGETLYPDYWNDVSIAVCPSDPRAVGPNITDPGIDEDWGEQIQRVSSQTGVSQELITACRSALLSVPVSYMYCAYAQQSMVEWAEAGMLQVEAIWSVWDASPTPARGYTAAEMAAAGCPDSWGESGKYSGDVLRWPGWDDSLPHPGAADSLSVWGQNPANNGNFDPADLPQSYPRLKEGVERFFITDINNPAGGAQAQSTIGVMWDAWGGAISSTTLGGTDNITRNQVVNFNHVPGGSNALFMDGHVEFVRFGSGYPCTADYNGVENPLIMYWHSAVGGAG